MILGTSEHLAATLKIGINRRELVVWLGRSASPLTGQTSPLSPRRAGQAETRPVKSLKTSLKILYLQGFAQLYKKET